MAVMKSRSWLVWVLAFVLTAVAAVYQRMTGPTYPGTSTVVIDGLEVTSRLPRSHAGDGNAEITLSVPDASVHGTMEFRRFRSNDPWSRQPLERRADSLVGRIPHQPPAGKVLYQILLAKNEADPIALTSEPVIIRFRKEVPAFVMIPHVILIFAAMLVSTVTGLEALFGRPNVYRLALWAVILLFLGGLVGGPVVQKCAFDVYWTGWPLGHDLTDNKTAVAFVFWLIALWRIKKKSHSRGWAIAASLVLLTIFLIPHSLLGSELDYTRMPEQPGPPTAFAPIAPTQG
jgi:hypothetical protein